MGREPSLGEVLRAARGRAGWSQREAARRIGVSHGSVTRWEQGLATPHAAHRERALAVYGLSDAPLTRAALSELEQRVDALERRLEELAATRLSERS